MLGASSTILPCPPHLLTELDRMIKDDRVKEVKKPSVFIDSDDDFSNRLG
jgi:hypothetical protein